MAANIKLLLPFTLLILWLLLGCGSFAINPPPLSQSEILATADAIRAMTPIVTPFQFPEDCDSSKVPDHRAQDCQEHIEFEGQAALEKFNNEQATNEASIFIDMANDEATQSSNMATADAAEGDHRATLEAEALEALIETVTAQDQAMLAERTKEAEALATDETEDDRWNDATMEVVDATADAELATYEAGRTDCPDGCIDYPTWCKTVIKGNVAFEGGERIYHMRGDEFYEETKINPDYGERYFCTPEEAEAAGFRRAYN